jgi:hypothetical protein
MVSEAEAIDSSIVERCAGRSVLTCETLILGKLSSSKVRQKLSYSKGSHIKINPSQRNPSQRNRRVIPGVGVRCLLSSISTSPGTCAAGRYQDLYQGARGAGVSKGPPPDQLFEIS